MALWKRKRKTEDVEAATVGIVVGANELCVAATDAAVITREVDHRMEGFGVFVPKNPAALLK